MTIDAELIVKIKLNDLWVDPKTSGPELKQRIQEEGEKRLRYYFSGYLQDPENKIIEKEINFKVKQ